MLSTKKNCHDEDFWFKERYFHHLLGKIFNGEILLYEVFLLCMKTIFQYIVKVQFSKI